VITRQPVYPPIGGAPLRNWQNISILKTIGEVYVFEISIKDKPKESLQIPGVKHFWVEQILKPNPTNLLAKLFQFVKKNRWLLTRTIHPWTHNVYFNKQVAKSLEQVLTQHQPDIVVIEELWLAKYIDVAKKWNFKVILDQHNIEGVLRQQLLANPRLKLDAKTRFRTKVESNNLANIEREAILKVNQTWVCGENDKETISLTYGVEHNIKILPNGIDVADYADVRNGSYARPDAIKVGPLTLLFPATFGYGPNMEAAEYMIEKVKPLLDKENFSYQIAFVGRDPTDRMRKASADPSIIVTGMVDDMMPYWAAADIVIVPLLQGGGTRLKILEAFASGKPVVSTTKGAEGIEATNRKEILLAQSTQELVDLVTELSNNPKLQQSLAENALSLVKLKYSREAVGKKMKSYIKELTL